MLKKEIVKEWTIEKFLIGRGPYEMSNKIFHVPDVNAEAKKINPLREDSDADGCVEYIPDSVCDLKILIKEELYTNIEKATHKQDDGKVVETSMCYRLWYVETLAHECTHYFELINLYKVICNGVCYENEDIRLMRQFSEFSATKAGFKFYFMALDHFNAFDPSYLISTLDNYAAFYESLLNKKQDMPRFLYHQIRLLALISAWKEYYHDDKAEQRILPFFADISAKDAILNCLSVDLEKVSKTEVVALGDEFLRVLNNSTIFH
ncbi:MAG: hypothetical protein GX941_04075 [Candidatus Methanofastidiosa archaeon]|jgi:hypothetical protein|nr:hypothetical protein [Candidatus Methanofastidiosa archaeon]